jgi:hypothetical protein
VYRKLLYQFLLKKINRHTSGEFLDGNDGGSLASASWK